MIEDLETTKNKEKEINIMHNCLFHHPEIKLVVLLVLVFFWYVGNIM